MPYSTNYIIAILRETVPATIFTQYAEALGTGIPKDFRPLPESPVYARPSGYVTIYKSFASDGPVCRLLDLTRRLTSDFSTNAAQTNESTGQEKDRDETDLDLFTLTAKIFASPTAEELDLGHMSDRYTYEAIRLTSHIYAQSIISRVPFSQAAQRLQTMGLYRSLQPGTLSAEAPYMERCAMHIHVRNALMRTDTTDCWGHMAGVLFWIALIAGAAGNPEAAPEGYVERRESGEEEEARKWLAAVVVRCSIVLGFEYGAAIMETVKKVVGIQRRLAE